jgi:DNA processing protein
MELADLVALARLPLNRRRLAEAVHLADAVDGRLATALESLGSPESSVILRQHAAAALDVAQRTGITPVAWDAADYPPALRTIPDPPLVLWVKGTAAEWDRPAVAIVGARAASPASRETAREIGEGLARAGVMVVSGLARGCDGAAHQGALAAAGLTVAVLGCGVDITYPPEHDGLARAIAVTGALVSELAPGTPPLPLHFPLRNRIIAGLSRAVVVIEAHERSGSLITAACALEQGRDVMVVPGSVRSGRNRGAHALLKDGAALVECAADVLAELGAAVPRCREDRLDALSGAPTSDGPRDRILAALDPDDGADLDDLQALTGLDVSALTRQLTELELAGLAVRQPGGRFVRSSGKVIT